MAAVDLVKHKDEMLQAWKEVVNDKSPTNWALFTYDGQSYDLKLASKGDGGITELAEELNSCKIMYAFCRVKDPKTSLPKYVLINWQGESTPGIRKGTCANHLVAIQSFFKGIHITVNARTEDEVDEEAIIEKVAKSTGSVYNFNRIDSREDESSGPVGTIYKRVNPTQEINAKARDSFWAQEEQEEKRRLLEEQRRKQEESKRREEELKQRELEGSKARENQVLARMRSISELRHAEEKASKHTSEEMEKAKWIKQKEDDDKDDEERRMRSELLRRQRNNEAQSLIRQRSIDARAVFEQNTSAGQLSVSRRSSSSNMSSPSPTPGAPNKVASKWPPTSPNSVSPAPVSPTPMSPTHVVHQTSVPTNFYANNRSNGQLSSVSPPPTRNERTFESPTPTVIVPPVAEFADAPPQLPASPPPPAEEPETSPSNTAANNVHFANQQVYEDVNENEKQEWEPQTRGETIDVQANEYTENETNGYGIKARALYDYQAGEPGEISFDPGDIITNIDQIDEGWWQGVGPDGTYGLFPANYVELID